MDGGTPQMPLAWKGRELVTIGDIAFAVTSCETRQEAEAFMAAYRIYTPHADANVGYLSGYEDRETRARIHDWFGVVHPIFGRAELTTRQLLAAGRALAAGAAPEDLRAMLDPELVEVRDAR